MDETSANDDNFLRIGDYITLKQIRYQSYLSCEGILADEVFISSDNTHFDNHLFQVCTQRQYSATMEYEDFLRRVDVNNMKNESDKKHHSALVKGKGNEMRYVSILYYYVIIDHIIIIILFQ